MIWESDLAVDLRIVPEENDTFWDAQKQVACVHVERGLDEVDLTELQVIFSIEGDSRSFLISDKEVLGLNESQIYCFDLPHLDYHYDQISSITKELDSLYDVLIEPEFYDEWEVSDNRIEIMMKKHDGKIYLFAASAHYEDIHDVTITLDSKYTITSVTALNDVINGDIDNPVDRVVAVNGDGKSFTDDFVGDSLATPGNLDSPGYAVHVYEIEYS